MFGHGYFGAGFFGPPYFGPSTGTTPPVGGGTGDDTTALGTLTPLGTGQFHAQAGGYRGWMSRIRVRSGWSDGYVPSMDFDHAHRW